MFKRAGLKEGGLPLSRAFQYLIFKASEDIMTKFKSQTLHIIRTKYLNPGGSGNHPFLIPALWNIAILLHKQATPGKHFEPEFKILLKK